MTTFLALHQQILNCTLCKEQLPLAPNPLIQIHPHAKILVASQAPGLKAHNSRQPFADKSGERLRQWMGIDERTFYNAEKIAIVPMAFCYPGRGKSGDNPPSKICPTQWQHAIHQQLKNIQLTLVIGQYAHRWYLPANTKTLTETVKHFKDQPKNLFPLPHPSPRNNIWLSKNPWFEKEVIPELQNRIQALLKKE